jgi:hypothetical protein
VYVHTCYIEKRKKREQKTACYSLLAVIYVIITSDSINYSFFRSCCRKETTIFVLCNAQYGCLLALFSAHLFFPRCCSDFEEEVSYVVFKKKQFVTINYIHKINSFDLIHLFLKYDGPEKVACPV